MNKRKRMVSILAGIMAAVMLLTLLLSLIPVPASAMSSSEIRQQINALKTEKSAIQKQIKEVQAQYEENENEIENIVNKKNVVDQEIQLLTEELNNINEQITAFNTLIADKQDELDAAVATYREMNEDNLLRIRAMEEEGELSYWEVLFKANSFSDLLDRLNMVEEIASSDKRRLQEMSDAADAVAVAQAELETEKADLQATKDEMDATQVTLDEKRAEADELLLELVQIAEDLQALEAEYEAQEEAFLQEIAQMEIEYTAAKQAEWEAYMATMTTPATTQGSGSSGSSSSSGGDSFVSSSSWMWPTTTRRISSPFGYRESPTAGASTNHLGVDIDGNTGDPVWATRAGVVVTSGWASAAGNWVRIDHRDGYVSIYMHLNTRSVSVGQIVSQGQTIGTMGATGVATGDHLHFGITKNGSYINPMQFF